MRRSIVVGLILTLCLTAFAQTKTQPKAAPKTQPAAKTAAAPAAKPAAKPAGVKIGDYLVSVEKVGRAPEFADKTMKQFGMKIAGGNDEEVLIVDLAVEAAGKMKLSEMTVTGADGKVYKCSMKEVSSEGALVDGKPSTKVETFHTTITFVLPKGTAVDHTTIQGVDVPLPKS